MTKVLEYRTIGNGPVRVLFAHAWSASSAAFEPLYPYLDVNAATWLFPDFRGYGASAALSGDFTIREMAADLLALVDELGWDRFHVVGHSMGGQAAQLLAAAVAQDRIETLTLISAVPSRGFPVDDESAAFFSAAAKDPDIMAKVCTVLTGGLLGSAFGSAMGKLSVETSSPESLALYLEAWTQNDVSADAQGFGGSVLALVGENDPVLTAQVTAQQITNQYSSPRLVTLPGVGHFAPLEAPARLAALVSSHVFRTLDDLGDVDRANQTVPPKIVNAVKAAFTGYERNDRGALNALLAPNFTFEMSDSLPYGGQYVGPDEWVAFWKEVSKEWRYFRYEAREVLVSGAWVIVPVQTDSLSIHDIPMKNEHLFLFRVEDDRIVFCRLYADTARGRDVVQGIPPIRFPRADLHIKD